MTSKEEIIKNIKRANLSDTGLPEYDFELGTDQNWLKKFIAAAENSASTILHVDDIMKLCRKGPTSSNVESIKIENYQQEYFKKSFDILGE